MSARRRQTSMLQFEIMVAFMELHGDLCKPRDGARGKMRTLALWEQLTRQLNSNGSGDTKTEEKWKKVWSDLKNNIKKKAAKIGREARQTGGGPAFNGSLTDLEQRVISIIGPRSVTGLDITEAGLDEEDEFSGARVSLKDVPVLEPWPVAGFKNVWSGIHVELPRASTSTMQTPQRCSNTQENDRSGIHVELPRASTSTMQTPQRCSNTQENDRSGILVELPRASTSTMQKPQRCSNTQENGADDWSSIHVELPRASTSTMQTPQRCSNTQENGTEVTDTSATGVVPPMDILASGQPRSLRSVSPEHSTQFQLKRVAVSPPGQRRKKMRRQLQSSKVDAATAAFVRSDEAYHEREKAREEREAQRDAHQLRLEERRLDLDERRLKLDEEWQRLASKLIDKLDSIDSKLDDLKLKNQ